MQSPHPGMLNEQQTPQGTAGVNGTSEQFNLSLSEDSASPLRAMPRLRSSSPAAAAGGRFTKKGGMKERGGRPPSPLIAARRAGSPIQKVKIKDHEMVVPEGTDVEGRLVTLERQQKVDHDFLQQVAEALRMVGGAVESENQKRVYFEAQTAQMDHTMRKEVYAMRDQLAAEAQGFIKDKLKEFFDDGAGKLLTVRMAAAEATTETLRQQVAAMQGHTAELQGYVKNLYSQRPQEGQAIEHFVHTEVGQVRELVKKFEGETATQPAVAVPFTTELRDFVLNLEQTAAQHGARLQEASGCFKAAGEKTEWLYNVATTQDQRINVLEGIVQNIVGNMMVQGAGAGTGTGTGSCEDPGCGPGGCSAPPVRGLGLTTAFSSGVHAAAAATTASFGTGASASSGLAGGPPPGPHGFAPAGGGTPSGGGDFGRIIAEVIRGNGACHCVHVSELMQKVAALEARGGGGAGGGSGSGGDPWHRAAPPPPVPAAGRDQRPQGPAKLPLDLKGPLGAINFKDRSVFDEKLALQDEYKFNGSKGGTAWKGKVERHFISRSPILRQVLEWAESCELEEITVAKFRQAVGVHLTEDQVLTVNAALWGFLSAAVSGTAETMFKRADTLNGLDAWRILVRYIDHGRSIRLETLRREVKMLHMKPISSLEKVEEGIAEWENVLNEYLLAGGTAQEDSELKSDLLAVLPGELRETLLWRSTDESSFQIFRDHVLTQSAKILMNRKKLPIHAIAEQLDTVDGNEDDLEGITINSMEDLLAAVQRFGTINSMEDLVAAVQRFGRNGQFRNRNRGNESGGGANNNRNRGREEAPKTQPRRCVNCGKTHPGRCTQAPVDPSKRPCWGCGEAGHVKSRCPKLSTGGSVKAVGEPGEVMAFFAVDNEGFQEVSRRKAGRPMPTQVKLGNYLSKNMFSDLERSETTASGARSSSRTATATSRGQAPAGGVSPAARDGARPGEVAYLKEKVDPVKAVRQALAEAERIEIEEVAKLIEADTINVIYDEEDDLIATAVEKVKVRPAMDSGAVANVLNPKDLPSDAEPVPNTSGKHFVGAKGDTIEKYGTCDTICETDHGMVGCHWQLADVTRPLHSVSQVTGPKDGPGKQDVLFNNRRCVVVPPGVVDEILKKIKPVMEYPREGNLYVADATLSAFRRQGQRP